MSPLSPQVSIIIPCRNEERSIDACLRSVLAQESPPGGFEVLVADGRSSDRTREVVRHFMKHDPRVRLIDNPQLIVSVGLNRAIQVSKACKA